MKEILSMINFKDKEPSVIKVAIFIKEYFKSHYLMALVNIKLDKWLLLEISNKDYHMEKLKSIKS